MSSPNLSPTSVVSTPRDCAPGAAANSGMARLKVVHMPPPVCGTVHMRRVWYGGAGQPRKNILATRNK